MSELFEVEATATLFGDRESVFAHYADLIHLNDLPSGIVDPSVGTSGTHITVYVFCEAAESVEASAAVHSWVRAMPRPESKYLGPWVAKAGALVPDQLR